MAAAGANPSRAILASLGRSGFEMTRRPIEPSPAVRARQLADQVVSLIGAENAAAECEKLGGLLRALGAEQDSMLAVCRMKARWLRQSAAMLAEDRPGDAELAGKIQSKVEEMLRTK
jgi:cytochrome c oxidase assembly factor CtaG